MSNQSISSLFFRDNRKKLIAGISADALIITANSLVQASGDQALDFRQDANFWYLTGLNEPDLVLVATKDQQWLMVPDYYHRRQSGIKPVDQAAISEQSGIKEVVSTREGWSKLASLLNKQPTIATLLPATNLIKYHGIFPNPARARLVAQIRRHHSGVKLVDARKDLAGLRMIKQPVEIDLIMQAIDITLTTLGEVLESSNLQRYTNCQEIEADISTNLKKRGASGHAFEPVIACGRNAALIHFSDLNQPLKKGQLIVCDVGCRYQGYCSDITRTVSYGETSKRQRDVFEAVKSVQKSACQLIKPGVLIKDYEHQVEKLVGQQLLSLGLIKTNDSKSVRKYYPHACSHSLGLDPHDAADYSLPLADNMVLTVEPGIYIQEESVGARLEDVVRVTKDGCQLLSKSLASELKL